MERQHTQSDAQVGAFRTEHTAAYLMAAVAIVLTVIGLLRGFGMLGDTTNDIVGEPTTLTASFPAIWDAVVWLLPALSAALLSWALHQTDHHRMTSPELMDDANEGAWKGEHAAAYLMAVLSIATGVLGILVGFDVLSRGNDQPDALPWLLASLVTGVLTNTLHTLRHHQLADETYVTRLVEHRLGNATITAHPTTEYGTERRP